MFTGICMCGVSLCTCVWYACVDMYVCDVFMTVWCMCVVSIYMVICDICAYMCVHERLHGGLTGVLGIFLIIFALFFEAESLS